MGLVAHWRLEGNANDSFGEYNGFEVGGPNYSSGKIGNCYDNTGNNAEGIELIRDDEFGEYEDLYSFSLFFKSTTTSGDKSARVISRDASEYPTVVVQQNDSSPQELYFYEATNDAGNVVDVNEWHHLAFTIDTGRNNSQLFLDGELIDSGGVNDDTSARPYVIGGNTEGDGDVSGSNFIGKIDDVRLYDHILSAKEVKQLSQAKVLHYKFEEDGFAGDASGNGNRGKISGPTPTSDSKVGNQAYVFTDSDGFEAKNNPTLQVTTDLTISFWAKPFDISSPSRQNPIHKDYRDEYTMTMETDGDLSFYFNDSDSAYNNYQAQDMFQNDNEWVHVTAVRNNGTNVEWYRNGEFFQTRSWNGGQPVAGNNDVEIGYGYVNAFNGILDDFRIYASALSDNEVKEIYEQRASIDSGGNFHSRELSEEVDNGLKLNIESAGNDSPTSGFSKLIVNGNDIGAKGRGINALEIDSSGNKVKTESFDVYGSSTTESNNLVDFIDTATSGNILMFAEDDHAGRVEQNAISALQELGSIYIDDVSNDGRSSWAFICIKGGGTYGEEFAPSGNGPIYVEHIFPDSLTISTTGVASAQLNEVDPAPASLVGWWLLDGSTDEHSGKSGDASPTVDSPSIVGGFGQSAYRFDESGSGDRLQANLNRPTNTEITASAWIFPNSSADERAPIVRADRFYFQHYEDDSLATYWYGSQNNGYHYSDAGSVPINVWSHVVATWDDSGNINFYANGDKINTVTGVGGGPRDELDSIRIGQESSGRRFNGKIQDVRIYDRALTSKEVEILYNLTDPEQKQQVIVDEDSTIMTKNQFSEII